MSWAKLHIIHFPSKHTNTYSVHVRFDSNIKSSDKEGITRVTLLSRKGKGYLPLTINEAVPSSSLVLVTL